MADEMAQQTAETVRAARFVEVLRQLLAAGACRLLAKGEAQPEKGSQGYGEVLGWAAPARIPG